MDIFTKFFSDLSINKSQQQALLLIWEKFLENGKWPSFVATKKIIKDTISSDSSDVVNKLQPILMFNPNNGNAITVCRLTIVGILSIEKYRVVYLVILLKYLVFLKKRFNEDPDFQKISSTELGSDLTSDEIKVLAVLISIGNFYGHSASGIATDGYASEEWHVGVINTIADLDDSEKVEEFLLNLLKEFVISREEHRGQVEVIQFDSKSKEQEMLSFNGEYVANERLAVLRELNVSLRCGFDLCRLIRLLEELNSCYCSAHYYACAMLLRAVIDHVPPIFGKNKFAEVANSFGRSKKSQLLRLDNSLRDVGDGVLHTHIRKKEILISVNQIRFEPEFDILLSEIILKLQI